MSVLDNTGGGLSKPPTRDAVERAREDERRAAKSVIETVKAECSECMANHGHLPGCSRA